MAAVITDDPVYMDYDDGFTNYKGTLTVTPVGRVGINDTEPSDTLELKNAVGDTYCGIKFTNTSLNDPSPLGCRIGMGADGDLNLSQLDDYPVNIKTKSTTRLIITPEGRVGINDETVGYNDTMEIKNATGDSATSIRMTNKNVANSSGVRIGMGGDGTFNITQLDAYDMNLKTDSTTRLCIKPDGKIGVGTTDPTTALQVNGVMTCTSINVISNSGTVSSGGNSGELDAAAITTDTGYGYEYTATRVNASNEIGYVTSFNTSSNLAMGNGTVLTSSITLANLPLGVYIGSMNAQITPAAGVTRTAFSILGNTGANIMIMSPVNQSVPAAWSAGTFDFTAPVFFKVTTAGATGTTLAFNATVTGGTGTFNSGTLTVMRIG